MLKSIFSRVKLADDSPSLRMRIPENVLESLQHDREAFEREIGAPVKAKYKIEVHFGPGRTTSRLKPSRGAVITWESGKQLHGGGDEIMHWCGYPDCSKPMSGDFLVQNHAVCPHCQRVLFRSVKEKSEAVRSNLSNQDIPTTADTKLFSMTPDKVAMLVERTWRELEGNADIYLKFSPNDIRFNYKQETMLDIDKQVVKARTRAEPVIYTLDRIIQDTAGGATLYSRILAFLTA